MQLLLKLQSKWLLLSCNNIENSLKTSSYHSDFYVGKKYMDCLLVYFSDYNRWSIVWGNPIISDDRLWNLNRFPPLVLVWENITLYERSWTEDSARIKKKSHFPVLGVHCQDTGSRFRTCFLFFSGWIKVHNDARAQLHTLRKLYFNSYQTLEYMYMYNTCTTTWCYISVLIRSNLVQLTNPKVEHGIHHMTPPKTLRIFTMYIRRQKIWLCLIQGHFLLCSKWWSQVMLQACMKGNHGGHNKASLHYKKQSQEIERFIAV